MKVVPGATSSERITSLTLAPSAELGTTPDTRRHPVFWAPPDVEASVVPMISGAFLPSPMAVVKTLPAAEPPWLPVCMKPLIVWPARFAVAADPRAPHKLTTAERRRAEPSARAPLPVTKKDPPCAKPAALLARKSPTRQLANASPHTTGP